MLLFMFAIIVPAVLGAVIALWGFAGCGAFDIEPPDDPTDFDAKALEDGTIEITWTGFAAVTFERDVLRSLPNPASSPSTAISLSGESPLVDDQVTEATDYSFVAALYNKESQLTSNVMKLTTTLPSKPENVSGLINSDGNIELRWTNTSKSKLFIIQRQIGTGDFEGEELLEINDFPHVIVSPPKGSLQFQVIAVTQGYNNFAQGYHNPIDSTGRTEIRSDPGRDPNRLQVT